MRLALKYANLLPSPVRAEMESLVSSLNAWIGKRNTWSDITYSASDFSGLGLMTWTVGPECITTWTQKIDGDVLRLWIELFNTSVGGTPGTDLQILIPGGKTAAKRVRAYCRIQEAGTPAVGMFYTTADSRYLSVQKLGAAWAAANWSATTKTTHVLGAIDIPVVKG